MCSVRVAVNQGGTVISSHDYSPYGSLLPGRDMILGGNNNEKYKFTGKERDNETVGLGTEGYDYFGKRLYDSFLGIWLQVDPMADKYSGWSPYNYCANDPVNNTDPNGMWILGSNGKRVTYSIDKNGGTQWSANATADVRRVGNAMLLTKTGTEWLNNMINSEMRVKINISPKIQEGNGKSLRYGISLATGVKGTTTYDKKGKATTTYSQSGANITIYEGSIKIASEQNSGYKLQGLEIEQAIGAVATHEAVHSVDEGEIPNALKNDYEHTGYDSEKKPRAVEEKVIDEYHKE